MRNINKFLSILLMAGMLSACAAPADKQPEINNHDSQNNAAQDENKASDVYEYHGEMNAQFNGRGFTLEAAPKSSVEELVVNNYYYDIASEYDKLSDLYGDNEALKISAANEKKNFDEGIYVKDYVIHEVTTLTQNEIDALLAEHIQADIDQYSLSVTAVVKADIDFVWGEDAVGAQIDSGRYPRIFLCGKVNADDDWLIYEIYWGEMYGY